MSTTMVTFMAAGWVNSSKINSNSVRAAGGTCLGFLPNTLATRVLYASCFLKSYKRKGRGETNKALTFVVVAVKMEIYTYVGEE